MVYFVFLFNEDQNNLSELIYKHKSEILLRCDTNKTKRWFIYWLSKLVNDNYTINQAGIDYLIKYSDAGVIKLTRFLHKVKKFNLGTILILDKFSMRSDVSNVLFNCLYFNIDKKDLIAWTLRK